MPVRAAPHPISTLQGVAPPEVVAELEATRDALVRLSSQQDDLLVALSEKRGMRRNVELWQVIVAVVGLCITVGGILINYTSTTHDTMVKNTTDVSALRAVVDQVMLDNKSRDTNSFQVREDVATMRADIRWMRDEWDHKGPANTRTQH
jgi:hypothetical protein